MLRSWLLQVPSNTLLLLRSSFLQVPSNMLLMLRSSLLQVPSNTLLLLRSSLRQVPVQQALDATLLNFFNVPSITLIDAKLLKFFIGIGETFALEGTLWDFFKYLPLRDLDTTGQTMVQVPSRHALDATLFTSSGTFQHALDVYRNLDFFKSWNACETKSW